MCQQAKDDTITPTEREGEQTSAGACAASTKTASGIVRNSRRSRKNRSSCNEVRDNFLITFRTLLVLTTYSGYSGEELQYSCVKLCGV